VKLRTKTIALFLVTTICLLAAVHAISYTLLSSSYGQLEEKETTETVEQVQSQLANQFSVLDSKLNDWSNWDDAYQFVQDNNSDFQQTNLVPSAFVELGVNFILFFNLNGAYVDGMGFSLVNMTEMPVPPSLLALITATPRLWNFSDINDSLTGVVVIPQGPLVLAARPILTSEGQGPTTGTIIFARYFGHLYVQSLSTTLRLPLTVTLFSGQEESKLESYSSTVPSIYVHPLNATAVVGYDVVSDINGQPALVLAATMDRDTYDQGLATENYVDLSVGAASVAFSIVMLLLMERVVLSRLQRLDADMITISGKTDSTTRLPVSGDDEIASLSTSINKMLGEIDRKTVQLRESERFSTIGELAAMVAHDLRNPLQGIANAAFYVKRSLTLTDKEKEMLTVIQEDVRYSDRIVSDLLDYSKNIRLELTEMNPRLLIRDTLSMVVVPDNIRVEDETQAKPTLRVDVDKIKRVFINIINNAIDAMPGGGSLMIQTIETDFGVDFVFADSGEGMTKEVLDKIFTPLFTTKAKGMGFGLSICKRIVEAHGGKISAESVPGKGTTFTISLPLNADTGGDEKS
jgi:signal transduction histidine kinase